jgi:PAS domain S-box-containing protein
MLRTGEGHPSPAKLVPFSSDVFRPSDGGQLFPRVHFLEVIVMCINSYLVALPAEWEERIRRVLVGRGHAPKTRERLDGESEILHNGDPAIVVVSADGSLEDSLCFCRRLRNLQPTPNKLQILACASSPPSKEDWELYRGVGVSFVLPADFTDQELEFRLSAAECFLLNPSPTGDVSPSFSPEFEFTPDTEKVPYGEFFSALNGRFLRVNNGLVHMLGYSSKEELMRAHLDRDIYFDHEERARRIASVPSHNITFETLWKRRDGSLITIRIAGHVVMNEKDHTIFFKGVVWDITEQKRNQEMLRLQRDLAIALSRIDSLREMVDIVLDSVLRIEGIDCPGFFIVEPETRIYRLAGYRGLSPAGAKAVGTAMPDEPQIRICEMGKPFYQEHIRDYPHLVDWCASEGMRSSGCFPIFHDDKVIATLNLGSRSMDVFPESTKVAVETIAMQIGGTLARVQAEESLRASQANLQTFFDAMSDVVLILDFKGHILHFNAAAISSLGYDAEELKGKHFTELHPQEFVSLGLEIFDRGIKGLQNYARLPLVTEGGSLLPMEIRVGLGTWAGEQAMFAVLRDCTEEEASRKALEQSEARFRAIFENAAVGIGLSNAAGIMIDANDAVARMEDITREEIIGRHFLEFTTPEDGLVQSKLYRDVFEGKIQSYELEKRYFHKDGTPFWIRCTGSIVPPPEGEKPQYLISIIENIDARKKAEESLRESERRYRLLAENASDVVWSAHWSLPNLSAGLPPSIDPAVMVDIMLKGWRFEYISPALEKVLGYTAEEAMVDTPATRIDPACYPALGKIMLDNLIVRPSSQIFEFPLIAKDGSPRWCEVTVNMLHSEPHEPIHMMGILRDISQRHETEEALRKSESQVRGLFENLPDVVLILDKNAQIVFINHGIPGATGEITGANIGFSLIQPSYIQACYTKFVEAWSGRTPEKFEFPDIYGNFWSCQFVPMFEEDAVYQVMAICTDITAAKKAAQEIQQEQRLLRQLIDLQERERRYLSYEIHDGFSQQITGAMFHLETYQRIRESDAPQAEQNLEQSLAMLRRSIDETRRLISGLRPPILDEAGIVAAIEYLVCEHRQRSGIDIMFLHNLHATRLAPPVECAAFRIVQESLTNACRHSGSDFIRVEMNESGERLQIVIFDEGRGFDPAAVPDERFGLRSIRERARLLGGSADIQAAPDEGCRVRVELPLVPAAE